MNSPTSPTQTITITGYNFQGPFINVGMLLDLQGVYVILDKHVNGPWFPIDVGEAGNGVKTRMNNHDRKACWIKHRQGTLGAAVLYTTRWTDQQRCNLEAAIRNDLNPPCGQR